MAVSPPKIVTYYPCGGSYSFDLWVRNVIDLGAFEVCSGYDNSLVDYEEVVVDSAFLGSTGRNIYPLDPVWCDPSCHIAGIRYGACSAGDEPGPSGDGSLTRIFFSRLVDGAADDSLCLEDWELVNTQIPAGLIDVDTAVGADIIHRSFCYRDFNDGGHVTVIDIMQVAGRWGCCVGEECYVDTFDVNLVEPGSLFRRRQSKMSCKLGSPKACRSFMALNPSTAHQATSRSVCFARLSLHPWGRIRHRPE